MSNTNYNEKVMIFGCGGHARSAADIFLMNNKNISLVFIDSNAQKNEKIFGFNVVKNIESKEENIFIAIGDNQKRMRIFNEYRNYNIISVISQKAYISNFSEIGKGCFLGNFCNVGPNVIIGDNTIVNTASVIEHEVKVGKHCHIAPNSIVAGRTIIGNSVFIGAGSTIIDKISICSNCVIGAGSTVINDINDPGVYVGSPARRIR